MKLERMQRQRKEIVHREFVKIVNKLLPSSLRLVGKYAAGHAGLCQEGYTPIIPYPYSNNDRSFFNFRNFAHPTKSKIPKSPNQTTIL